MENALTNRIKAIDINDELKTSFLDYSMSVIVSRALPDVRDGLKPVHRRILYAMHQLKNFASRPYLKSARIVGDVIGKYHPHGDSAVYDALVRLAQPFSIRNLLIDGQGNFGSIDGDSAAAMRYTEVRLHKVSELLLQDIEKETVNFGPNYDNKELEPLVLPTRFPQLLVNGASGIAVGMATNIPPHNLGEVCEALLALIDNPKITIQELMAYIKGPDFPTYGSILGLSGILQAYQTGRGSVTMRAKASVEELEKGNRQRIIITELPYQVNKARLIEKIAELVNDKKIEGITDIRDESAQEDIRVVVDLRRGEVGEVILNNLYKLTPLQGTFGVNMVALVKGIPKLLNLKEMIECFYLHRREVVIRRTAFDLRKAEERAHILEGLKIAVENLDLIVKLIRSAQDSEEAHAKLTAQFSLSDIQAKAILDMRLARLTGLERDKIIADYAALMLEIERLKGILSQSGLVTEIIKAEIVEMRDNFTDPRRTEVIAADAEGFSMESLVADEDVAVTVSHVGYVKRTPLAQIQAQKRGGRGRQGMTTKAEDVVRDLFISRNHQALLCFTNLGRVYEMMVYQIPEAPVSGRGKHFANILKLQEDETVVSVLPIQEYKEGLFVVSVTQQGFIKKTELMAYAQLRATGIIGLKLEDNDRLVSCRVTSGKDELIIATRFGKAVRFTEEEVRAVGRSSRGVVSVRLDEGDAVISFEVIQGDSPFFTVCERGYGKRTPIEEYRVQGRGGKGIYTIKVTERNGPVVGVVQVADDNHLMVMTSSGKVIRFQVNEVGLIGRLTQGVKLVNLDEGERIISLARIQTIEGEEL